MSQTKQTVPSERNCCCNNKPVYEIIYVKPNDKKTDTNLICSSCFDIEQKAKDYSDTLIKPFQKNSKAIICMSCNQNVTATMGCDTCHPKKEQS